MKVGTDGIVLGAWTPIQDAARALDVGTGSGLLALMLAQRSRNLMVDAVEIESAAARQARVNVANSPWSERVNVINLPLQELPSAEIVSSSYDLIVANPPYFHSLTVPPEKVRELARHDAGLSIAEVIKAAAELLSEQGRLCMIAPAGQLDLISETAGRNSLFLTKLTWFRPLPDRQPNRILCQFERKAIALVEDELLFELEHHLHSADYAELTKEFYLRYRT